MSKNYEVYFTNPDSPMILEQWLEDLLQDNRELVTFSEGYWIFRIVEPLSTMECTTDNAEKDWNTRPIEDKLRAEIERLKSERRWIPVSERLPHRLGIYLVYFPSERGGGILSSLFFDNADGAEWVSCPANRNVTHWMPLPTPPEGV